MKLSIFKIATRCAQPSLYFAAEELRRYLSLMLEKDGAAPEGVAFFPEIFSGDDKSEADLLRIGTFEEFGLDPFPGLDAYWDDAIFIQVRKGKGIIAGLNPRSALFAVYRFLEKAGCRWLRPGKDGDWVPARSLSELEALEVDFADKPAFRYRGHSNCGGYHEVIMEKIDWMAKVGLNICFEEFFPPSARNGHHLRRYPSLLPVEKIAPEVHTANFQRELAELKKRGILFQSVGHGWSGAIYDLYQVESPEDRAEFFRRATAQPEYVAEVNGERRPHRRGGALYTELCYGNPEVQEKLVGAVIAYAQKHPEVDLLHFSMSDAMNLMCECPLCRHVAPSDFLVLLLNRIDEELEKASLNTRIGFFLYQEVWWPPVTASIANPSRFLLYFCPIARDYQTPYPLDSAQTELPPFVYNRNERISDLPALITSLRQWQAQVPTEAIGFDYHLTWYQYFDPGQFNLARLMLEDIRRMPQIGLSGYVSCQTVRASFPTGFLLNLHAAALWNPGLEFDAYAGDYFRAAFGEDGAGVIRYLDALSQHFRPGSFYRYFPLAETPRDDEAITALSEIPAIVESVRPLVERNLQENRHAAHYSSWQILFSHLQLIPPLAAAQRAKLEGRQSVVDAYWDQVLDYLLINENRLHGVLDNLWFYEAYLRRSNLFSSGFRSTGGFEKRDVLNVNAQLQDPRD